MPSYADICGSGPYGRSKLIVVSAKLRSLSHSTFGNSGWHVFSIDMMCALEVWIARSAGFARWLPGG
jgi:hypothetical protein